MLGYSWIQWLFFFFFYSFFGWCFESTYVSLKSKKLVNRGFIRGPFLPLYGSGALMMLIVSMPVRDNLLLTYVAGCLGATVLEYVTGVTMEALFKVRYWDYSKNKFNFQGQICLGSSLAWGGLTILMTHVVHRPIEAFAFWLPEGWLTAITMVTGVYFTADFALSFKAALDLRDVLVRMERAKQDLERMQRRLDMIIALTDEAVENQKKEWQEGIWELREEFSERMEELGERLNDRIGDRLESLEELSDGIEERFVRVRERLERLEASHEKSEALEKLRARFTELQGKRILRGFLRDAFRRSMLRGNPTMTSGRFAEALEELKKAAEEYKKKNEHDGQE